MVKRGDVMVLAEAFGGVLSGGQFECELCGVGWGCRGNVVGLVSATWVLLGRDSREAVAGACDYRFGDWLWTR